MYFIVGEERGVEEPGPVSHKLKGRLLERFDHLSEEVRILRNVYRISKSFIKNHPYVEHIQHFVLLSYGASM